MSKAVKKQIEEDEVPISVPRIELGGRQGILPSQTIWHLIQRRVIQSSAGGDFLDNQVQPSSIDLKLGARGYRVRTSFLPGKSYTVEQRLKEFSLSEFSLTEEVVLERGCFYVIELQEILRLPDIIAAVANPKSSTGRLDVFTRLITDYAEVFDWVESKYKGKLFVEICPMTFSIKVRKGSRLNQLRFLRRTSNQGRYDRPALDDKQLLKVHHASRLVADGEPTIRNGLNVRVDLLGANIGAVIGYKAKRHTGIIDIERVGAHAKNEFWEPIHSNKKGRLILDPQEFYILASKERMHVPPAYAAEMAPIDPMMGEFRAHYAGFFDPGFGNMPDGDHGSRAVLEVRSHDVPFALEDGQIIARLVYEHLTATPSVLYGRDLKSNYQGQGLKLSKHFK
ncbi:MAG: 2'-deoxycytidine 5'-triphosphate deaminase [Hyphomicrobium sp.]